MSSLKAKVKKTVEEGFPGVKIVDTSFDSFKFNVPRLGQSQIDVLASVSKGKGVLRNAIILIKRSGTGLVVLITT